MEILLSLIFSLGLGIGKESTTADFANKTELNPVLLSQINNNSALNEAEQYSVPLE